MDPQRSLSFSQSLSSCSPVPVPVPVEFPVSGLHWLRSLAQCWSANVHEVNLLQPLWSLLSQAYSGLGPLLPLFIKTLISLSPSYLLLHWASILPLHLSFILPIFLSLIFSLLSSLLPLCFSMLFSSLCLLFFPLLPSLLSYFLFLHFSFQLP